MAARVRVFLGLGSNEGDSRTLLRDAVEALARLPETRVAAVSSVYRTAPVGYLAQPDFLNQVVEIRTGLEPLDLLDRLQSIEASAGRVRRQRWGPRTLDIDILWYDGRHIHGERLEVPHPRIEERRFVLEPWAELAPDLNLPHGCTVREALERTTGQDVRLYEPGKGH